jgi:hypothetical protein
MKQLFCISLGLLLCTTLCLSQKTIRVPQDSATIQAAINAAVNGDTVLVAEGTYSVNLKISKKIVLGSLFIRDDSTSHISKTILDGGSPVVADSASVILIGAGTDSTTQITGFTIRNGRGTRSLIDGVYWRGGLGINIVAGAARITHNIIADNSLTSGDALYGGGICIWPSAGPLGYWIIEHNRIIHNQLSTSISNVSGGAEGGGAELSLSGRFCYNTVYDNTAIHTGTGTQVYGAGGGVLMLIPSSSSTILFANNEIRKNRSSRWAGALYAGQFLSSPLNVTFLNNIISGNTSPTSVIVLSSGEYTFVNNTIADNQYTRTIWVETLTNRGPVTLRMLNNILWNSNSSFEIQLVTGTYPFNCYSNYNLVRGGWSGTGNISSDPLFVTGDTLYRLQETSPCIAAGIYRCSVGGTYLLAPRMDYLGNDRPRPDTTKSDLGAIEHDSGSVVDTTITGIEEAFTTAIPENFTLGQNFPNPFNSTTTVEYQVPKQSIVTLKVFDLLGRKVATLVNEMKQAGTHTVKWDAPRLSSGVYFYTLRAGNFRETKRMILMK